ncbi:MAG TPA: exopolyphosphatase [Ruminococcaceae bacterium]|nr:exopolyphosphatase [Oscillospiraceae bacterium]
MIVDIGSAAAFLAAHDNYIILCHEHPDGDTLGSGYGLCRILRAMGKKANVRCRDEVPKKFRYLMVEDEEFEEQTVVAVDIADPSLMGTDIREIYGEKVHLSLDHHGSSRLFAEYTYVDAAAAATAEIIVAVAQELKVPITKEIADCLFTGITTDTGCFRYANVTARTHNTAAHLMNCGADAAGINMAMFETKTKTYAALERLALESMEYFLDDRCAIITVTKEMFAKSGSDESECDAIASLPRQIEGVMVGVTIRERSDGSFKASVRSRNPVDALQICAKLGGGGHKNAAGCQLGTDLAQAKVKLLAAIEECL